MTLNIIQVYEKLASHRRWLQGDVTGERAVFVGENLSGMNLSQQYLAKVDFTGADLSGANLSQVLASESIFTNADLTGANLSAGIFFRANFDGASIVNATLVDSSFDEASFINTMISNSDMRNATFTVSKMTFPVYSFKLLTQDAVATPTELRLGTVVRPWHEWTNGTLTDRLEEMGALPLDMVRHLLHVDFFRQVLRERGYSI